MCVQHIQILSNTDTAKHFDHRGVFAHVNQFSHESFKFYPKQWDTPLFRFRIGCSKNTLALYLQILSPFVRAIPGGYMCDYMHFGTRRPNYMTVYLIRLTSVCFFFFLSYSRFSKCGYCSLSIFSFASSCCKGELSHRDLVTMATSQ